MYPKKLKNGIDEIILWTDQAGGILGERLKKSHKEIHKTLKESQRDSQTYMLFFGCLRVKSNTENTKSLTSCFSAWAKKADVDTEGALLAALDTKEEIPIIPYSSLFILSSENKYDSNNDGNKSNN